MFGFHSTAADVDARTVDFGNVQIIERDTGSHDVSDRIDRAHFVEMDFVYGNIMRLRFRFAQFVKHS